MQVSTCWVEDLSADDSLRVLSTMALSHAYMGGKVGLEIAKLIKRSDWRALVDFEVDLRADWDVESLFHCRQALAFFQKLEFLEIGVDKEAQAYSKFTASEVLCSVTNQLFRAFVSGTASLPPSAVLSIERARRKIERVLGPAPDLAALELGFGPGATTSLRRRDANPMRKFSQGFKCSTDMLCSGRLAEVLREVPHWVDVLAHDWVCDIAEETVSPVVDVEIKPGRLEFVPKNAKTYRSIVVEPVLNSFVQHGIGRYMERRLRRAGIDIKDQRINARLAREGSITGGLATIDLSSASDTIAFELVKFLLPYDWFRLLKMSRTGVVTYRGSEIVLEKFSSMGNGYTFPLETLIFWALSASVQGSNPSVYGDDIVVRTETVDEVIRLLEFCGFQVNKEKSFWSGPFRESCGKDYYLGIDIRPYYQKHLVSGRTLFTLHNYYWRYGDADRAKQVRSFIPRCVQIFGPDGYGDGHLLSDTWGNTKPKHRSKGWSGVLFSTYTLEPRREISVYPGDYVTPLYSIYARESAVPTYTVSRQTPRGVEKPAPVVDREFCEQIRISDPVLFSKSGRPYWPLPGWDSYKRISIYTLA